MARGDVQTSLISAAEAVFKAFSSLEFAANTRYDIDGEKLTLQEFLTGENSDKQIVTINGTQYTLHKEKIDGATVLTLSSTSQKNAKIATINSYNQSEQLDLIANQTFILDDNKGLQARVQAGDKSYDLGGKNKEPLYPSHISSLANIIAHLQKDKKGDIKNLLVALTTGSGKTYLQAVYLLVLDLANINSIFAMPDNLTVDFKKEWLKVLPKELHDKLIDLRKNSDNDKAKKALSDSNAKGQHIIASYEELLDKHYGATLKLSTEKWAINFDEAHKPMQSETRRVRLTELARKFICMLLTATPNKELYQLSGKAPVAKMSAKYKKQAGMGELSHIYTTYAKTPDDQAAIAKSANSFGTRLKYWFLRKMVNQLQEPLSSSAKTVLEEAAKVKTVKEIYKKKNNNDKWETYKALRWNIQRATSGKMLILVDDNSELVNIDLFLRYDDPESSVPVTVYQNGNLYERYSGYSFLNDATMVDHEVQKAYKKEIHSQASRLPGEYEAAKEYYTACNTQEQLKWNILHNFIEYIITDVTGLDTKSLNQKRQDNLEVFAEELANKIKERYENKLLINIKNEFIEKLTYNNDSKKGIDREGAEAVAILIVRIISRIKSSTISDDDKILFADNWSMCGELRNVFLRDQTLNKLFTEYAENHMAKYVMSGMEQAEIPIEDEKVFSSFSCQRANIHSDNKEQNKKRILTAAEILNPDAQEYTFKPEYETNNETIANNYFKLGFIGTLVSNRKIEGFNDANLNTVVSISPTSNSKMNDPTVCIQSIGRNRGLDKNRTPFFLQGMGKNAKPVFNLQLLAKLDDYFPKYFNAQDRYRKVVLNKLGEEVADEVVAWLYKNEDPAGDIPYATIKQNVHGILIRRLREYNDNNQHRIRYSKKDFKKVLNVTYKRLKQKQARLANPYRIGITARIIASIVSFVAKIILFLGSVKAKRALKQKAKESNDVESKLYAKIIANTNLKTINSFYPMLSELGQIKQERAKAVEFLITNNLNYSNAKISEKDKEDILINILPYLVLFFPKEQREKILELSKRDDNFANNLVCSILNSKVDNFTENDHDAIYKIFHDIPGLEDLSSDRVCSPLEIAAKEKEYISDLIKDTESNLENKGKQEIARKFKNKILPIVILGFKQEYRATIFSAVNEYPDLQLAELLISNKDITQSKPQNIAKALVPIFKNIPKLEKLNDKHTVDPVAAALTAKDEIGNDINGLLPKGFHQQKDKSKFSRFKSALKDAKNNAQHIKLAWRNPTKHFTPIFAEYFNTTFISRAKNIFSYDDGIVIEEILKDKANASLFSKTLLDKVIGGKSTNELININTTVEPELFTTTFNECFKSKQVNIKLLDNKSKENFNEFKKTVDNIQDIVKVQAHSPIKSYIKDRFIPKVPDLFPADDAKTITDKLSTDENLNKFTEALLARIVNDNNSTDNANKIDLEVFLNEFNRCFDCEITNPETKGEIAKDTLRIIVENAAKQSFKLLGVPNFLRVNLEDLLRSDDVHALFDQCFNFLNENEITSMFNIVKDTDSLLAANDVIKFYKLLKSNSYNEIFAEFLPQEITERNDLENNKLTQILGIVKNVLDEQRAANNFFYQLNSNALAAKEGTVNKPKLLANKYKLDLPQAKVEQDSLLEFATSKLNVKALCDGTPKASRLAGIAAKKRIKLLNRINRNIIHPMSWGLSKSKFSMFFIKAGKAVYFALRDAWYNIKNGFKNLLRIYIVSKNDAYNYQPKKPSKEGIDLNADTFDLVKDVNMLSQYNAKDVDSDDCGEDVLEKVITKNKLKLH